MVYNNMAAGLHITGSTGYIMDKDILTLEEAAELFSVSVKTFIKLLKEEKVPARKIGREWRFSRKALIEWLSSGDSQAYSSSEAETKEFFNKVAPEWDELRSGYYDESIKNRLIQPGMLEKSMTVVDLGSGDGYISRSVAGFVGKVYAVDISAGMLRALDKKARNSGIENIQTVESDGQDVPLQDSCADVVFASMYLHHIEDPEIAIKEMHRLLKPGGTVFLADYYEHGNKELKEKMHDVWPGFKLSDVRKWFVKNGFGIVKIEGLADQPVSGKSDPARIFILMAVKKQSAAVKRG